MPLPRLAGATINLTRQLARPVTMCMVTVLITLAAAADRGWIDRAAPAPIAALNLLVALTTNQLSRAEPCGESC